jgi:hypothetical protein
LKAGRIAPLGAPWKIEEERIILCEGRRDKLFLEVLIQEHALPGFQVKHAAECNKTRENPTGTGGVDGFGRALQSLVAMTGFRHLKGIVIVTDNDKESSIKELGQKIRKCAKAGKYEYRSTKTANLIVVANTPVLIVPIPDDTCGNLETLCLPVLYDYWPRAEECVQRFLECTGATKWTKQHQLDKARVRSIISAHYEKEPDMGLGELFKKSNLLSTRHDCFLQLIKTLSDFDEIIRDDEL